MIIIGRDHILCGQPAVIMKSEALAELEHPFLRRLRGLEALGKVRLRGILLINSCEPCADEALADISHECICIGSGVETVRGRAMADTDPERAALLRLRARRPG